MALLMFMTFTPFMGVCLDKIQVVTIPSWASINVSNANFLEKWHGCAAFADPLWLIATIGIGKKASQED